MDPDLQRLYDALDQGLPRKLVGPFRRKYRYKPHFTFEIDNDGEFRVSPDLAKAVQKFSPDILEDVVYEPPAGNEDEDDDETPAADIIAKVPNLGLEIQGRCESRVNGDISGEYAHDEDKWLNPMDWRRRPDPEPD